MSSLALVPAWFWVALGTVLALAGLVAWRWSREALAVFWRGAVLWRVREWLALADWRRWRYSRQQARHVVAVTEAEGRVCPTCNPANPGWVTCVDYDGSGYETACPDCGPPDFYGSMTLAGERTLPANSGAVSSKIAASAYSTMFLPAEVAHGEPTAAEVAASRAAHGYIPELDALEAWGPRGPSESYGAWLAEDAEPLGPPQEEQDRTMDRAASMEPSTWGAYGPGPGGAPSLVGLVPPGPDQACCDDPYGTHAVEAWAAGGFQVAWEPERLADTGDIAAAHLAHPGPDTERLDWLDQQLAAHLEWARRVRGQATGWGLEAAA